MFFTHFELGYLTSDNILIKEPEGLPVKIRFDETSQFAEGSANVSVTTFLSGFAETSENWKAS